MSPSRAALLAFGVRLPTRDVIVLRRPRGEGVWEALSVVAERGAPRGIVAAHVSRDLDAAGVRNLLRTIRSASEGHAEPMPVEVARERIARALLVDRIAGRPEPHALRGETPWMGRWEQALASVRDLFQCADCGTGLPGGWQIALARGKVAVRGALRCACCARTTVPTELANAPDLSRSLAMAQLLMDVGEPRRALVLVARAEAHGAPAGRVAAIRGASHLALGNAVQAAVYLRLAVRHDDGDLLARTRLVEAEARCGLVVSAVANLEALEARHPASGPLVAKAREALMALNPHRMEDADVLELRCLQALALLDAGRVEEARQHVDGVVDPWDAHPAARLIREALDGAGPRPASHAAAAWSNGRARPILSGPLAALNDALVH
ncbi:MAG: tetratricopeptide repeat protein [Myxococcota bacterium]